MSVDIDMENQDTVGVVPPAPHDEASDLSDVELEDRSSSLSEIEDDAQQDDDAEDGSDDLSNPSDSEAETTRLEESPNRLRLQQNIVLNSERSPSKLNNQLLAERPEHHEDHEELLSDDEVPNDSPKSSAHDEVEVGTGPSTTATSLENSGQENQRTLSATEVDSRKRKRSIMAGSGLDDDLNEPLRKRTGSVMAPGDEYAIDDEPQAEEEGDISNPISGNISGGEGADIQEEEEAQEHVEVLPIAEDEPPEAVDVPVSPKKRGRKKKKAVENGVHAEDDPEPQQDGELAVNGEDDARNGFEDHAENEGDDEAEAALRNEEELEKKRLAFEGLSSIEKHFGTLRERLFDERLEKLNQEEAMLRQDKPTHPEYLAMMKCIEARRDERVRIANRMLELETETTKRSAVARRSQILTQYRQEVRDIREKKLEQLGKQWYEIQHDRRSYAGSVPDYTLKFPIKRSQQVMNEVAYANEVSILSGVAKYVGFPAAPSMAPATASELEDDLEKMGRTKHQAQPAVLPLQGLAALRSAGSTSRFKPAEEQFIEQTPWANPQHPSHAHLLQRQTSAQQVPRTSSPFSQVHGQPRRHSHQPAAGPIQGTFPNNSSTLQHTNGHSMSNPFSNTTNAHTIAPSPLGSRQTSLSPLQSRPPTNYT